MGKVTPKSVSSTTRSRASLCPETEKQTNEARKKTTRRLADDTPASAEPPRKRNRSLGRPRDDYNRRKLENGEEENVRRRRAQPTDLSCTFCKTAQESHMEALMDCAACKAKYHIRKCLRYRGELAENISDLEEWFCPRCITCHGCRRYIADPQNIECSACCCAYHGECAPRGSFLNTDFDSPWYCASCCKIRNIELDEDETIFSPQRRPNPARRRTQRVNKETLEFIGDTDALNELLKKRDYTWDVLNYKAGFAGEEPKRLVSPMKNGSGPGDDFDYNNADRVDQLPKIVVADVELFMKTEAEAYPKKPSSSVLSNGQFLHFGTGKACKAIYASAYEEPRYSARNLYACKFCLYTTHLKEDLIVHWDHCNARHPPGNEIYRDGGLVFFEVDGAVQKKYCQDLCLLAKLFIASKTLYDEVETFIFYVLCEITTEGFVIVGYFSKEKNPSKNNNLSCLLVLPMVQKMGYGRLLIDMSYELSRLEHRVGHPEHPLSDLGILAYRGYWRSSLLCYLRTNKHMDRLSIKDISLATRITPVDIVNQLMLDNMISFKLGVYSIKMSKRALKHPISQCRRRQVIPSKIIWRPKSTEDLDPLKLNTYV